MENTHFKKPQSHYVDDEFSDDEDDEPVYVPPSRRTLPNMNSISKIKGYNHQQPLSFKTTMKPIPALISTGRNNVNPSNLSRGNLMLSQVPGLKPIDSSKFFSFESFQRKNKSNRSIFNGTGNKVGTRVSAFFCLLFVWERIRYSFAGLQQKNPFISKICTLFGLNHLESSELLQ